MFRYRTTIRLRQSDAGGVLYFAEQMTLCHDAFEAFLADAGQPVADIIRDAVFALPIVHAEIDLLAPLRVGDDVDVTLRVERVGETSFAVGYTLAKGEASVGRGQTVHVAIDTATGHKRPLPDALRDVVENARSDLEREGAAPVPAARDNDA